MNINNINLIGAETSIINERGLANRNVGANPSFKNLSFVNNIFSTLKIAQQPNLESLTLHHNKIKVLDIAKQPNLQQFNFVQNYLNHLNLDSLSCIETLDLSGNTIKKLTVSEQPGLKQLNSLQTELEDLHLGVQPKLERVNLCNNNLTNLNLEEQPSLMEIDLSGNYLTALRLALQPKLESLTLYDNSLEQLNLLPHPKLIYLNLSANQLTGLNLPELPNLRSLDLSNNYLSEVNLPQQPNLLYLNLEANRFENLNLDMQPKLEEIHLSKNSLLTALNLARQPSLRVLTLISTALTELNLDEQPSLEEIDLCDAPLLTAVNLGVQPKLKKLHLFNCGLTELNLDTQPSLEEIDLCDAPLLTAVNLGVQPKLKKLHLFNCGLTELNLDEQLSLEEIDLSDNSLTALNLARQPSLRHLDLGRNELTQLPDSILSLPRNATVVVDENPFPDGYIADFRQRVRAHRAAHPAEGPTIEYDADESISIDDLGDAIFEVDIDQLLTDPKKVLSDFFKEVEQLGEIPHIRFMQNGERMPGQDEGGLYRQFITQLFSALHPKENGNSPLYLKEENALYFPKIINLPFEEGDTLSYQAIGMIYAFACNPQDPNLMIKTGHFFHPAVFKMIYSLTAEEANGLPENFNPENLDSVQDQIPQEIYNKLLAIYLRNVYPNIFNTDDLVTQFIKPPHTLPPQWEGAEDAALTVTSEFNTIILPVLIIAKSMCQFGANWAHMVSAEELQNRIQGQVTAEDLRQAIRGNLAPENTRKREKQNFLIEWIEENAHSEEMLKKLCYAASGSPYLPPLAIDHVNVELEVVDPEDGSRVLNAIAFHTCSRTIDIPNYPNANAFKAALTDAVNIATQLEGFDFA